MTRAWLPRLTWRGLRTRELVVTTAYTANGWVTQRRYASLSPLMMKHAGSSDVRVVHTFHLSTRAKTIGVAVSTEMTNHRELSGETYIR